MSNAPIGLRLDFGKCAASRTSQRELRQVLDLLRIGITQARDAWGDAKSGKPNLAWAEGLGPPSRTAFSIDLPQGIGSV